jgi:hypothetical protein
LSDARFILEQPDYIQERQAWQRAERRQVSNFIQTAVANARSLRSYGGSRSQEASMSRADGLSKADEFRQSTKEFWSTMDQEEQKRKVVAADPKPKPTSSGNVPSKRRVAPTTPKSKKRNKH